MSMLMRKRQIAAKIESVEGTAESLAAVDAKFLAYDPLINFDPELFERNPARASVSRLSKIVGKRPGSATFRLLMRGSGTATTAPEWGRLLRACGFGESSLYQITIGAVTSGPFSHGETITGGNSGATGRVVISTADGTTTLYFVPVSGTFENSETITGGTSGASATTGSTPSEAGKEYKPVTLNEAFDNIPSLTIMSYEHGIRKVLRGCRGKVTFNLNAGQPAAMNFEFNGVEAGVGDVAMLSGIAYGTTKPPAFLQAAFSIDEVAARIGELTVDIANQLGMRDDVNNDRGILSYLLTDRVVNGSFNPEMVLAATHDFHGKWFGGSEMAMDFTVGSSAGNKFRFYSPRVQYTKVDDQDRDGVKLAGTQFDLNGSEESGDDELSILSL